MSKYRNKPVVVDAFRFGFETYPDWFIEKVKCNDAYIYTDPVESRLSSFVVFDQKGDKVGVFGDFIICDDSGKIYPCKPEIFEKTYEPVN